MVSSKGALLVNTKAQRKFLSIMHFLDDLTAFDQFEDKSLGPFLLSGDLRSVFVQKHAKELSFEISYHIYIKFEVVVRPWCL
jgi:hypothetical protein